MFRRKIRLFLYFWNEMVWMSLETLLNHFCLLKSHGWSALTTITWKNKKIAPWYLRLIRYQCSSAHSQPVIMMTTKLLFLLVLLGVRNFLRQYCREKLNISWKSGQNALCKVFYVNPVTTFFFLLTSEKLVAYRLINVIGRGGFGHVLAGTWKFDDLPVRSY